MTSDTKQAIDQGTGDCHMDDLAGCLRCCPAKGRAVLSRVLAERDPDRDPQYALDAIAGDGWYGRWLRKRIFRGTGAAVLAPSYGIDRQRQLKPIEHLTRETTRWSFMARGAALMRLGDTADRSGGVAG